eukprot:6207966-Pleurochrysis_carterae.AAC.1
MHGSAELRRPTSSHSGGKGSVRSKLSRNADCQVVILIAEMMKHDSSYYIAVLDTTRVDVGDLQ